GLEGYERLIGQMREKGIDLPLIAIGGIMYDDIPDLWEKGVSGIALSGSVLRAENPVSEMKRIVNRINQTEKTI
ncbi:MAG: thiamine phosphate synthase, partial [Bacteroidetes bacterium]|nr:thiamine phosphate synthase [Candidatus Gallipaludibacter merdavium]